MPQYVLDELIEKSISYEQSSDLLSVLHKTDVLYVTRIQKERFNSLEEYNQVSQSYIIDQALLKKGQTKEKMIIMHPLPR